MRIKGGRILADDLSLRGLLGRGAELDACARLLGGAPRKKQRVAPGDEANDDDAMPAAGPSGAPPVAPQPAPASPPASSGGRRTRARARVEEAEQQAAAAEARARPRNSSPRGEARVKLPELGTKGAEVARRGKADGRRSLGGLTEGEVSNIGGKGGAGKADTNATIRPTVVRFHSGASYRQQFEDALARRRVAYDRVDYYVDGPVVLYQIVGSDRPEAVRARQAMAPLLFGERRNMSLPADNAALARLVDDSLAALADEFVARVKDLLRPTPASVQRHGLNRDRLLIYLESNTSNLGGAGQPVAAPWEQAAPRADQITPITSNLAAPNFGGTARDAVYLLQKQRFEVDRRAKGAAKTTNQTLRDFIRFAGKVEPDGRRIAFGGTSNVLAEKKAGHVASTLRLTVGMLARLAELVRVRLQGHQDAVEVRLVLGEADGHIIADAAEDARQAQGNDTVVRVAVSSDRDLLYMSTEATGINGLLDLFDGPKRRKGRTIPPAKGLYWKPDVLKSLGVTAEQLKASVLISGSHNTTGSFIGAVKVRDLLKAGMPDRGAEDNYMIAAIKYLHARPAKEVSKRTREVLADGSAHRTELVRAYNETEGLDPAGQPLIRLRVPVGPFRPPPGTLFPKVNGQGVPLAEAFAGVGMTSKTMDRLRREIDKLDDKIEAGGATREMERLERERTELRGIIAEQRGRYGLWKKYSTLKDSLTAAVPAVPDSQPRPATAREAIKQRMHAGLQGVAKRCKAGFKIREEREEAAENHARSATKTFTDTTSGKIYLAGKAPIDVLVRGPAQPPAPAPPPPPAQDAPPTPVADVEMADEEAPIKKKPVSRKRKGKDLAFRTTAKDRSESEESEKDDEEATRGTTNKEPTPVGAAIVTVPGPLLANLGTDGWVEGMTHFRRLIRAGGEPSAAEVAQFMDGRLPDEAELLERGNLIGFLDTACTTTQRALMLCYATLRVVLDPYLAMGSNNRAAWFPQPGVDELPVFGKVGVIYRTLEAVALALRVPPDALAQTKDDAGVKIRHFLLGLDRQLKLLEAAHLDPPDIVSRLTAAAEKSTSNAQRTQLAGSLSTLSAAFHDLGTRLFPGPLPNPKAPEIKSWHLRSILLLAPFSSFVTPRTGNQEEDVTVADIRPPAPNPIGPPVPYDLTGVASLVDDDKMWYRTSLGSSAFAPSVLAVLGIVGGAAGLHGEDFVDSVEQGVRQHLAGIEPKVRGNPLDDKRHWLYGDLSTFDPDLPTTLILCNCPKVSVILGTRFHLENPTNRMLVASVNAVALDRLRVRLDEAESRRSRDGEDAGLQAEVAALKKAIEDIEAEMTILKEGNTVAPTGDARWDAAQRARKRVLGNIVFSDVQKLCPNIFRAKDPGASAGGGSNNGSDNGSDDTDDCCCDDCCRAFLPPADPSDAAENDRRRRIMDIHRLLQLELLRHDLRAFKPGTVIGLGRNLRRLLTAVGGNQQELRLHPLGFATGGVAQVRMRDSAGAVVDFEAIFAPHPVAGVKIPSHLVDSLTALALIPEPRPHAAAGHDATGAARPDLSSRIRSAASRAVDNVLVDACTTGLPMKADIVLAAGRRADVPEDLISLATRDSSAALFKDFAGDHFAAVSSLTLRNVKNGVKALAKAKASAALTGQATGAEPSGTNRAARALRSLTYRLAIVSNPRTAEAGEDESDDEGSDDEGDGEAAARDDRDTLSKIYCAPLELEPIQQDIAGLRALHADSDDALQLIAKFEAILISAEVDEPRLRTIDAIRATIGSTGSEFEPKDLEPLLLVRQAVADGSVRQRIIPRLHTGDRFVPVNSTIFSKVVAAYVGHVVETTKPAKQDQLALHDLLQRWDLHELAGAVDQRKTSIGYSYPVSETRILLRKLLHGIEELAKGRPRSDTQPAVSISTTPEPDRAPQGAGVGAGQAHAGPSADPPDPAATAPTTPRDRLLLRSANGFLSNGHATRITYHKQHRPYGFDRLGGVRTHAKETPKHWKWHSYCKNCETDGNDECDRAFPACSSCKDKGRSCVYSTASCEQCQKKNRVCDGVMPQCGFCERDGNNGCTWENVTSPAEFHDVTAGRFERELLKLAGSCKVEPGRPTPGAARTSKFARIVVTEGELCSKPGSAMAGQPGVQKADKGGKPSIYFFNHEHSEGAAKGAALRGIFVSMDPGTAGYTFTVTAFIESREQGGKLEQLTVHKKFAPLSTKEFGAQDESERSAEWWAAHERFSEGMKGVSRSPYPFDGQLAAATFLDNAGVLYSRSQSRSARMAKERLARAGQARKDSIVNWILASCDALWRRKTYIEAYNKAVDNAQVDWEGNAPSKERLSKIRDEAHARGNAAVAAIAEIPNPIVLCGAGQGSSSRMPYHGGIAQFLARHFLVVMLGEYTTSQICPTCLAELKPYPLESGDVEHKVCPNCRGHSDKGEILGKLVLNKNRSATLCLLRIFLHILSTGSRPAYRFTHPAALRNAG
ncbi:hypothetical protein DFJ74DRAFT_501735 [Hyaloraphidium curvatum]|nr:hypothetical protein DFJ74DRAFT_501735 [Hyaloraphidium curvatum]